MAKKGFQTKYAKGIAGTVNTYMKFDKIKRK